MKNDLVKKTWKHYVMLVVKILLRTMLVVALLLVFAIALIQIPAIQNKIKQRFVRNLAEKWKTRLNVGYISINLWGDIIIRDIFIGDQQRDTLLNVGKIKVAVNIRSIFNKELVFNKVSLSKVYFVYQVLDTTGRSNIDFIIKPAPVAVKEEAPQSKSAWNINFRDIDLEDIRFTSENKADSSDITLNLGHLAISLSETDIKRMQFGINTLSVNRLQVIQHRLGQSLIEKPHTPANKPLDLTITLNEVTLKDIEYLQNTINTQIALVLGDANLANGSFSGINRQILLRKITLTKSSAELKQWGNKAESEPADISTGTQKKEWLIAVDDAQLDVSRFIIANASEPNNSNAFPNTISLKDIVIELSGKFEGAKQWQGSIQKAQFTDAFTNKHTSLKTEASLRNGLIKAEPIQFTTGESFLNGSATFDIPSKDRHSVIPNFKLTVYASELRQADFISYLNDSIRNTLSMLPQVIRYKGNTISANNAIHTTGSINTSEGNLEIKANMNVAEEISNSTYDINLSIKELQAGQLLKNPALGKVTGTVKVEGKGTNADEMNTRINADIELLEYKNYPYRDLSVNGSITSNVIDVLVQTNDPMLKTNIQVTGKIRPKMDLYLSANVPYMNAHTLGITTDTLGISANIKAHFVSEGKRNLMISSDTSTITIQIPTKNITSNNKILYKVAGDTVNADIKTSFADITYAGNLAVEEIPVILKNYFSNYFTATDSAIKSEDYFDLSLKFKDFSVLNSLTNSKIEVSEDAQITTTFRDNKLSANFNIDELKYNNIQANDINFLAEGRDSSFQININIGGLQNSVQSLTDIKLESNLNNGMLLSRMSFANADGDKWFDIGASMEPQNPAKNITVITPLLLNYQEWEIKPDNLITFTENRINPENLIFTKDDKRISIFTEPNESDALSLELENLNLSFLSEILRGDSAAITGKINGKATAFNLFSKRTPLFNVNLEVNNMVSAQQQLGDIQIKASNANNSDIAEVDVSFGREQTWFNIKGGFGLKENIPMDLLFTAKDFQIASVQTFINKLIDKSSGTINASIRVQGQIDSPKLNGELAFDKASLFVVPAQTSFRLNNQRISFEGDRLRFPNFTIEDADGNPLAINGDIAFSDFKNLHTNLKLTSREFRAYQGSQSNIPGEENRAIITSDIDITGGINNPRVRANIQVEEDSKFFYKITRGATNLSEEGVIVFVGAEPKSQEQETESASTMENLNLTANIKVANNTEITIITDPSRNLGLNMKAGGVFSMEQRPQQAPRLMGRLNVSGGDYTIDFSGIKRKLEISDSSSITWYGDIARPELNLRVRYEVRASPAELLGSEATEDKSTLPFLVNMTITGDLSSPQLRFYLSVAREYEGVNNGLVAAKLKEINYNESDVNQKAMALLLFGRFDFSDLSGVLSSSAGGTNALITNALNQFSAQKIRFIDLHFDLESYNNYGETTTENQRTQLLVAASRKFMDNRLNAQVGATFVLQGDELEQKKSWVEKTSPAFNVSYILNKSRSLSVGAFRRSEYRGLIEGKVVSTGAGIIFQKDFDTVAELFQRLLQNNSPSTIQKNSK